MARKTNKAQVLELAATLGVEVEYGQMGSEGFEVALYGHASHMAFDPMGEGHTAITNQAGTGIRTEAGIWGAALRDLREFVPCADNCHCRVTVEAMRTIVGIVNNVSRETVTLVETSDGWKWWIQSTLDRGTSHSHTPTIPETEKQT